MAEQVGKFLTELPELETPTDGDLMYIVDDETTSKKVTMANLKRVLGGNVTGTVEGASVSFSDGADGIPMKECEVTLTPTQDLHGYSKPWAGGAGKNKFDIDTYTLDGAAVVVNNGEIEFNNSNYVAARFNVNVVSGQTYTLSLSLDLTTGGLFVGGSLNGNNIINERKYASGDYDISITPSDSGTMKLAFSGVSAISTGKVSSIQFENGASATTYEPYSNICPISGHTDVTITVASTSGGSGDDTTVSLGRTVYGGMLDVTTGELTVTHGRVDLGSLSWITGGSGYSERYQSAISGIKFPPDNQTPFNGLCECYEVAPWGYLNESGHDFFICQNSAINALAIRSTNYASQTDFENAINGKYLVYELATPQTFNLTPTQVETLLGQNYVSHDGGGNIKVVYIRDLDIVINDLINRVTALENE